MLRSKILASRPSSDRALDGRGGPRLHGLHLKGFSLERIRQRCLDEGIVPAKSIPTYTATQIDKPLKNLFYAAIPNPHADPSKPDEVFKSQFVWQGQRYDGKHEPIFTADEWLRP